MSTSIQEAAQALVGAIDAAKLALYVTGSGELVYCTITKRHLRTLYEAASIQGKHLQALQTAAPQAPEAGAETLTDDEIASIYDTWESRQESTHAQLIADCYTLGRHRALAHRATAQAQPSGNSGELTSGASIAALTTQAPAEPKVGDRKPWVIDPSSEWPLYEQGDIDRLKAAAPSPVEPGNPANQAEPPEGWPADLVTYSERTAYLRGLATQSTAVATVTISKFRGHLENRDFDYFGRLPEGTYQLCVHPADWRQSASKEQP